MLNWVATHDPTAVARARVGGLLEARVDRLQAAKEFHELGGQPLECGNLAGEERIASGKRFLKAFAKSVRLRDEEESR